MIAIAAPACQGDASPPATICAEEPDFVVPVADPSGTACNAISSDTRLAVRDGVLYFASLNGPCAADAGGVRLLATWDGFLSGPWIGPDGLLDWASSNVVYSTPFAGGSRTPVHNFDLGSSHAVDYDGRFVYVVESNTLWRAEPASAPERLGDIPASHVTTLTDRIVAAGDHVDVMRRTSDSMSLWRFDLGTRDSQWLFSSPGTAYLLGTDGDMAYVNHENFPFAHRDRTLARVDGAGNVTSALGDVAPPMVSAMSIHVAGDQLFAGVGLQYGGGALVRGRASHLGVLALPRDGVGGDLVFCAPGLGGDAPGRGVVAMAVDGDTVYAVLDTVAIVRFRRPPAP